jgi:hypothetical protein
LLGSSLTTSQRHPSLLDFRFVRPSFSQEIEQLTQKLEDCSEKKELTLLEKMGLHVLRRRLHDNMRQDLTTLSGIRDRFHKMSASCMGLIEDIKRVRLLLRVIMRSDALCKSLLVLSGRVRLFVISSA